MSLFRADIRMDLTWSFEVEAANEDDAYSELWKIVGYDCEDILNHDSDSEYLDLDLYTTDKKK